VNAASISSEAAENIISRLRWRLLPFLFLLYVIAFLDRINIGFAALTMNRELAITSQQFGVVAGIFFFGYSSFEIPSNLLLHKLGARIWIARILIAWGIVATLTGFVHTIQQLYLARFLLGVAEAGYFPGIVLYLTYWFRQRDQAQAIALFMTALPVSNILGAPLSGLILDHIRWLSLSSWRWLLILEGCPALIAGISTYFLLPNRPVDAKFLSEGERSWLVQELKEEEDRKGSRISALQALADRRVWHMAAIQFFFAVALYTMSFWLPQVIKSLAAQYSNTSIGLLVTIPYLAALLAMVLVSRHSDRTLERRYHTAVSMSVAGVTLLLIGASGHFLLSIVLLCFVAGGIFGALGPFWSLPGAMLSGYAAAAGIALVNAIANIGGFVGPYSIGAISKQTGSFYGGLGVAGVALLISATLVLLLPKRSTEAKLSASKVRPDPAN
jgi:ACS family tartrate transporter-like MFS transporter